LLQITIEDYREHAIDVIIAPHLVEIKECRILIKSKILPYNELERFKPSLHEFLIEVRAG
jgi:hypothetical protein